MDMRNMKRALVAGAIAVASIGVAAPPAAACTENQPCWWINFVCETALGRPCIR